ncbi:MAG: iron ABC transporter permease [Clostridiales bacterium]|jgi:iron complex transport system permease protein|nr:iron ABC transporter permease [Clostridiales bacterium]
MKNKMVAKNLLVLLILGGLLVLCFILNISFGPVNIPPSELWQILMGDDSKGHMTLIVWQVRLPRSIAALFVGMALAAAGTILQAVMQNPLAAPSLIGVNSGAGLMAMFVLAFLPGHMGLVVPATFIGALFALFLTFLIAGGGRFERTTLVLGGVAVSAILGAGVDTIRLLRPEAMIGATTFMIGGFAGTVWSSLGFALPWLVTALLLSLCSGPLLNVLSLGDEIALSLGVPVRISRLMLLTLAAVLAGSSVAIAGLLSFVGLIVPHAARFLTGNDQRWLMPVAMLFGGSFVLACDLAARMLFSPYELPVGILLSFLGGPFFIFLLLRNRREERL